MWSEHLGKVQLPHGQVCVKGFAQAAFWDFNTVRNSGAHATTGREGMASSCTGEVQTGY